MRKICVFVGANCGSSVIYSEGVVSLAKKIVQSNSVLVYGGANVGLMGCLANAVLEFGGEVIGVIPNALLRDEIAHQGLTSLHVVDSMQERKKMMCDLSDAFIAVPGGLGTFEEIFEVWNAVKLGLYKKPIGFLNINGYFDQLINFLNGAMKEEFIKQDHLDAVKISDNPDFLIDEMYGVLDK